MGRPQWNDVAFAPQNCFDFNQAKMSSTKPKIPSAKLPGIEQFRQP
jgi:hypothetical protein